VSSEKRYTVYQVSGAPEPSEGRPVRRRRWLQAALWTGLGLVVVVVAVLGGSYLWFCAQVSDANRRVSAEVRTALSADLDSGSQTLTEDQELPTGMNLLLLGSDRRNNDDAVFGRSDTLMLVHIDPDHDYLSLLSLPRDLRVEIPGHGFNRLNAAYAFGGPALAIRVVEKLTGVDLDHYLEIGFSAFEDLTDALGGVYIDVDRTYFNDNQEWEKIDLPAGYQLLHGADALDYVRFRHDRNGDLGRMARQQRFLSAVREQAMGWNLPLKIPGLVSALFDNVTTDLGANELIKLAYWAVGLEGERIRQVTVFGDSQLIGGSSYVVLEDAVIKKAVSKFLTAPTPGESLATTDGQSGETSSTTPAAIPIIPADASPSTIPDASVWREIANKVPFAVRAPAYLPPEFEYAGRRPADGGTYDIKVGSGTKPAFRVMYRRVTSEGVRTDSYMGITATTWTEAPAASKGRRVEHKGTVFTVVGSHDKVERVWWKADGVLYWVSNTVTYWLSEEQMLAVAFSTIAIPPG